METEIKKYKTEQASNLNDLNFSDKKRNTFQ